MLQIFAAGAIDFAKSAPDAQAAANSRRREIAAELKTLRDRHPWAGSYFAGDGLGVNTSFQIAPQAGYVFEWRGCLGLYDRNCGAVTWTNDRIHLSFTFANKRQGLQGIAPDLIPVSWGNRHYLVPTDDLAGFCNQINEGAEPRHGSFGLYLLRQGDENKTVSGNPTVPREYQRYLLPKPVSAEIIKVGVYTTRPSVTDWRFKDTPVTLNAGSEQGLLPGMELLVTNPTDAVESVRILTVETHRSEAVMSQAGEDSPGPQPGWKLSTRAPWQEAPKR